MSQSLSSCALPTGSLLPAGSLLSPHNTYTEAGRGHRWLWVQDIVLQGKGWWFEPTRMCGWDACTVFMSGRLMHYQNSTTLISQWLLSALFWPKLVFISPSTLFHCQCWLAPCVPHSRSVLGPSPYLLFITLILCLCILVAGALEVSLTTGCPQLYNSRVTLIQSSIHCTPDDMSAVCVGLAGFNHSRNTCKLERVIYIQIVS